MSEFEARTDLLKNLSDEADRRIREMWEAMTDEEKQEAAIWAMVNSWSMR